MTKLKNRKIPELDIHYALLKYGAPPLTDEMQILSNKMYTTKHHTTNFHKRRKTVVTKLQICLLSEPLKVLTKIVKERIIPTD